MTQPQFYIKVIKNGQETFIPYQEPDPRMHEIEQAQMVALLVTLTMSMLMSVSGQLPTHARAAREIKNVEQAIVKLAKLNAAPLDDRLVNAGVAAWNAAIYAMQAKLSGEEVKNIEQAA